MEPITDAGIHTVDRAADFGPEVFLAVVVIILFSAFMYLLITQGNRREERMAQVVDNNSRALLEVSHMVSKTCSEMEDHEASTVAARQDVHDNKQVLGRIDTRTEGMDKKLDVLVGRANG